MSNLTQIGNIANGRKRSGLANTDYVRRGKLRFSRVLTVVRDIDFPWRTMYVKRVQNVGLKSSQSLSGCMKHTHTHRWEQCTTSNR
jgi:hypothetical protein